MNYDLEIQLANLAKSVRRLVEDATEGKVVLEVREIVASNGRLAWNVRLNRPGIQDTVRDGA